MENFRKEKCLRWFYEAADVLVSATIVIALMFTFLAREVGVVGDSMLPTLHNQDWLAVLAMPVSPRRGMVVIIAPRPKNQGSELRDEPLVKRVVAIGGDVVDLKNGKLWVNETEVMEPYLKPGIETLPLEWESQIQFPRKVPAGYCFVLGDNRTASSDSRTRAIDFVREQELLGQVLLRLRPFYARDPEFRWTFFVK